MYRVLRFFSRVLYNSIMKKHMTLITALIIMVSDLSTVPHWINWMLS